MGVPLAALLAVPAVAAGMVTANTAADLPPALGECAGSAPCSLRQALDAASDGDTVVVPALGATTTYTLTSGPLVVARAVKITGGGAGTVTVSAAHLSTVFDVDAGPTAITGLTIADGAARAATSDGGAITATADLTLRDDVFTGDVGGSGIYDGAPEQGGAGAVQSRSGVLTVLDSTFTGDAGGDGAAGPDDGQQNGGNGGPGAIAARSGSAVNVTVTGSTGGDGGAGSDGTDEDDVGEVFSAPGYGGNGGAGAISGPIVAAGGFLVQSSTLAGNFAGGGGAPGGGGDNDDGGPTLPGDPGGSAVVGVVLESSIAVSSQSVRTTCVFTRDGGHNLTFPAGDDCPAAVIADPLLTSLADNGGSTPTLAPASASPAIDAAPASVCPATDQRGIARPQGPGCDIGAFEHAPLPPPGDGGGGDPAPGGGSGGTPEPGGGTPSGGGAAGTSQNGGSPPGDTAPPSGAKGPIAKPRVLLSTFARCRRAGALPAVALNLPATGTVTATLQRVTSTRHRGCPSVAPARRSGRRIARVERHLRAGRSHLTITGARRLTPGGYVLTLRGSGWNATVAFWVLRAPAA